MSHGAWATSRSLRIRKVIQPEFGTHRCCSARPSGNNTPWTGLVKGMSNDSIGMDVSDLGFSEQEFSSFEAMIVN